MIKKIKKRKKVVREDLCSESSVVKSEKEILLELYQDLKDRNIRRIGDLENQIARAE